MRTTFLQLFPKQTLYRYGLSALVFLCTGAFSLSYAEEPDENESVYLMEEIVVTAHPQSRASESTVDKKEIQARMPRSAADVLAGVPGASVTVGNKNSSEITIRGFTSRDILIMVDGRPVNEPYYGNIDLSTIGTGNISRIRVVKGASSVRYGPNAMGGVVNIMTGGADDGPPVAFRFTAGSERDIRADLIHHGYVKNVGYRIHIGRNVCGGFPLSSDFRPTSLENGNLRDNSDYRRTDTGVKLFFGHPANQRWSMSIGNSHLCKGLPSSVNEPRFWRFRNWDRTSLDLDGEPVLGTSFRVKTKVYAERFLNELVDYRDNHFDMSDIYYDSTHDNRSAGFLVSSSYSSGGNGVTNAGFQVRWEESRRQADRGLSWFVNRTATTWVFVEHERPLAAGLLLRGGISGHLFMYDSWDRSSESVNPSLNLEWKLRNYTITGSVSRVTRFPTLNQLFSTSSGNPDLNPEWAYKGEVTVSRNVSGIVTISAAGFLNRLHDMIYRSGKLDIYHNIEKARLDGVEMNGELRVSSLTLFSGVTLLDARSGNGEKLEYQPSLKVDSRLVWSIIPDLQLNMVSRVVGRRKTEVHTFLPSYHVENTGIVIGENRFLSASLIINNIFDVNYEEEFGYPMAGRTVLAGIDWHGGKR